MVSCVFKVQFKKSRFQQKKKMGKEMNRKVPEKKINGHLFREIQHLLKLRLYIPYFIAILILGICKYIF